MPSWLCSRKYAGAKVAATRKRRSGAQISPHGTLLSRFCDDTGAYYSSMADLQAELAAKQLFNDIWYRGNYSLTHELVSEKCQYKFVSGPLPVVFSTSGMIQLVDALKVALSNFQLEVHDIASAHDLVVLRWALHGTHSRTLCGYSPTGRHISFGGFTSIHLYEKKVDQCWLSVDHKNILAQLAGVVDDAWYKLFGGERMIY